MKTIDDAGVVSEEERGLLGETKKVIQGFLPAAEVLLYGSAARGAQGPESDYDVLVLTDEPVSMEEEDRIRDAVYDPQLRRGEVISTVFYRRDFRDKHPGIPLHQEIDRDAIVL